MMIYDEYMNGNHAREYLNNNDNLEPILNIYEDSENEDIAIVFAQKINMITLFRGLAKAFCILEKLTNKDSDILINVLKHAIKLEKEANK